MGLRSWFLCLSASGAAQSPTHMAPPSASQQRVLTLNLTDFLFHSCFLLWRTHVMTMGPYIPGKSPYFKVNWLVTLISPFCHVMQHSIIFTGVTPGDRDTGNHSSAYHTCSLTFVIWSMPPKSLAAQSVWHLTTPLMLSLSDSSPCLPFLIALISAHTWLVYYLFLFTRLSPFNGWDLVYLLLYT